METVVALHRNHFGDIISFVTSGGRIISYKKAVMEAESGMIKGVLAMEDHEGKMFLSLEQDQSFDHLPDLF